MSNTRDSDADGTLPGDGDDQKSTFKSMKDGLKHQLKDELKLQLKTRGKADKESIKELIRNLSPAQRDRLQQRLAASEQASPQNAGPMATARTAGEPVPLSFAQEREWFRDRLFPGVAHNIAGALRLVGTLSRSALSATFDEIVRRHETLRGNIVDDDGKPRQSIAAATSLPIEVRDLTALPPDARASEWQRMYAAEIVRGFDLGSDPLLRATLLRLDEREHILFLTMHHIASDGWSIGVLMQELSSLYAAFATSKPSPLAPLPIQYADFAQWQRARMNDGAIEPGLAYWRKQLADLPPVLELAPDGLLHAVPSSERDHEAATFATRIEPVLKRELEELSRREDTTLFVTLLTAFMVLLARVSGREDLVIGSPVSGRTRVESEKLIGLFLNTLALRASLSPRLTFREAMAVVRASVLEGLEHADVPVEKIVQSLDTQRSTNVHPLYEIIFNFTPGAPRRVELPGLTMQLEDPPALIEEFSTQLFVTAVEGALELDLRYRRQRYSDARMATLMEQYLGILQQVVQDADRGIATIDLATSRSRALLPDPTVLLDAPPQRRVTERIADWIARTPHQPAIHQSETTLTYAQLGMRMEAIARTLRVHGLETGQVVAVAGPRSPGVIASMVGVFRSGGVLLTLSPDLPEQRQRLMLREAGARFVLHVGDWRDADRWLEPLPELTIVQVATDGSLHEEATAVLPPDDGAGAYVFFTSGSTGKPKAVLGAHAGLAHWLAWQQETFDVGPGDACGQLTGLSFDVVLRDTMLALVSGATLVLPTASDVASGAATLRWLERERISLIHTVPAVAETWLLDRPAEVTLSHLRRTFFAGEPLTSSLVARWREAFPLAGEIINVYGPTETTLAKCFHRLPAELRAGVQPLGRALPQTQALILSTDRAMTCGIGEPGEIAIRTPFRSFGYLNAPEENAKRFIANPFRDDPDDLIYLTGDRGVYGADGLLEFRGRLDHQIKIRGVRVEPMEVAVSLQSAPGVAACAVIARDDGPDGEWMLVAYIVLQNGVAENVAELQDYLGQRLPAAMVPSAFVFLDALPLTSNQKLDRDKLPPPSRTRAISRYVAPRDATELRLVQIWEELLNVRPIGVTDRFFEVGGHSLLALRLLVDVERGLGRKVPLAALFEEPTIEHLARVLRRNDDVWPLLVTLRKGDHPRKFFLIHPGGGTLMNYVHLVGHLPPELPIHGIQARGLDGAAEPHATLEQMAADYIAEMRRMQPEGPYLLAGHSLGGVIAFEIARQLFAQHEEVAFLGMFDSVAPLSARELAIDDERREDALRLTTMTEAIGRFLGQRVDVSCEHLCALEADEQIDAVVSALKQTRALPPGEEHKLIRNLLNVSKAHIRAHRAYRPAAIPVPITLFRVDDAQHADYPSAAAELLDQDHLGWAALTSEPVRIKRTSGNHITMLSSAHAAELAQLLQPCLAEALQASASRLAKGEAHV